MPEKRLVPVFGKIPASQPVVIPPAPGTSFDQWFATNIRIDHVGVNQYNMEVFWALGNDTALSDTKTNNILRDIIHPESLEAQLGKDFLDANPEVINMMPQFLALLAKIAHAQGVL